MPVRPTHYVLLAPAAFAAPVSQGAAQEQVGGGAAMARRAAPGTRAGPGAAVSELARGVDLLVAKTMVVPLTIRSTQEASPGLPEPALQDMERQLADHRLHPADAAHRAHDAAICAGRTVNAHDLDEF